MLLGHFRITLIHLQNITIALLFLIYLSCKIQTEKEEPGTYQDLIKALQNLLNVRVLNLNNNQLTVLPLFLRIVPIEKTFIT
ncbi:hypothetical protein LEP1GSC089_3503 [Leptospira interrogans serovar Autumnalis str. LP101]|uniref:Leucine rich repeat protein n=2 Tax=Leptospira interrogans TaxID=173 RepID=A0A0F6H5W1_LEPIR|nr:hypothetical protein [Leptospira interrogans]EKO23610.1 hypothetical protein LEP1GSC104_0621 [Leptospira interrogans str. UI 12621]EMN52776.1 hypothetical protein LEP1GSC089_3503 [Leptospira interrogans serovar Autumnalis str. LP101]